MAYVLQQKYVNKWMGCASQRTRFYNFHPPPTATLSTKNICCIMIMLKLCIKRKRHQIQTSICNCKYVWSTIASSTEITFMLWFINLFFSVSKLDYNTQTIIMHGFSWKDSWHLITYRGWSQYEYFCHIQWFFLFFSYSLELTSYDIVHCGSIMTVPDLYSAFVVDLSLFLLLEYSSKLAW